ncbi:MULTISPECIES: phosphatidylcholine synthase [unclassified Aureimonas]|uniref:phosphatidylcholine synthase n=1 Tax=unclassified Aureimonas TaxID=2615206 RepID=UPI0006F93E71|nr:MULTISPECIES: phosphatidylcholine/phosphatidylserine synthase [unclassified Aureimonas]KQT60288.1 phosphatidylcholine synthase [Aureimonas sp. Leaf427]KQT79164.1 phosphatidylcholine synthase [Aureimonas sp. Leaf460]
MADIAPRPERWRAFAVHLLTASGAFWAFMAIIAAAEHAWVQMFGWLGLALFVDAIDGPLARRVDIQRVLPNWSGEVLDQIIDYATYVIIPAFALYESGIIGRPLSFVAAGLIVISSAIYYADMRMKTKDYFFRGFPVAWNMVIFTFFAMQPNGATAFAFVVFCALATFLPVKFVHPVRVTKLRPLNLAVSALWAVFGLAALFYASDRPDEVFDSPWWLKAGILATGLYLFCIGGILQLAGRAGPPKPELNA